MNAISRADREPNMITPRQKHQLEELIYSQISDVDQQDEMLSSLESLSYGDALEMMASFVG